MTSAFLLEANKLKNIQSNLEKSEGIFLEHLNKQDGGSEVKNLHRELESVRIKDVDTTQKEVASTLLQLQKLKSRILEQDLQNIDLTMLKKEMIGAQSNLQNMRHKHKTMLEKLEKDEKILLAEMHAFEEKLSKWENRPTVLPSASSTRKIETFNNGHYCQEVVDFLKFVTDSGGHDGGWSHEDHNLYLKMKKKYRNPKQMTNCFHNLCPDLSVDEIKKHDEWYQKYTDLKEKQKVAIQKWRDNKNKELSKRAEEKVDKPVKSVTFASTKKDTRESIQEKIEIWKKQRELQNQAIIDAQKEQERREKEAEGKKKNDADDLRMEVRHWRQVKRSKEQEEKLKREMQEYRERELRIVNSKKMIKHFQSQDDVFIERMKKSRSRKRSNSLERPILKSNAPRDPERLFKPTKQWIFRTLPKTEEDLLLEPKQVCNVRFVPKLGVPAWRK